MERIATGWKKKDKRVKKEIYLRLYDEYLVYIDQTTTTPELWAKLKAILSPKQPAALSTFAGNSSGNLLKTALTWRNTSVSYTDCINN